MNDIALRKQSLRTEILSKRKDLALVHKDLFTENLLALVQDIRPKRVVVYEAFGSEPETRDFIEKVNLPVVIPVTLESTLDFHYRDSNEPTVIQSGDLLLLPALAVDLQGNRLGRGKAYFDKTLAELPEGTTVYAVVYEEELLSAIPHEEHDQRVDGVVTQAGIHKIK